MGIITIFNQKGGVGKTTTAVNLAGALAMKNSKVLVIDLDIQANATSSLGLSDKNHKFTIYDVINGKKRLNDVIIKSDIKNIHLIPAHYSILEVKSKIDGVKDVSAILSKILKKLKKEYEFIIIDSAPILDNLIINILFNSQLTIIPIQCESFAITALENLLNTLNLAKKSQKIAMGDIKILPTMFIKRNNISNDILSDIIRDYKNNLFFEKNEPIIIPRNVKIIEALSFGKPVCFYDKKSSGAVAYMKLANNLFKKR